METIEVEKMQIATARSIVAADRARREDEALKALNEIAQRYGVRFLATPVAVGGLWEFKIYVEAIE